jgi:hypothetical protein
MHMLKKNIANMITESIVRQGDATGHNSLDIPFVVVTNIAEAIAEDIVNLIEETQARYYEQGEPD